MGIAANRDPVQDVGLNPPGVGERIERALVALSHGSRESYHGVQRDPCVQYAQVAQAVRHLETALAQLTEAQKYLATLADTGGRAHVKRLLARA